MTDDKYLQQKITDLTTTVLFNVLGQIQFCKLAQPGKIPDSVAASRGGYYSKAKAAFEAGVASL